MKPTCFGVYANRLTRARDNKGLCGQFSIETYVYLLDHFDKMTENNYKQHVFMES